jgi:hypothetical protein
MADIPKSSLSCCDWRSSLLFCLGMMSGHSGDNCDGIRAVTCRLVSTVAFVSPSIYSVRPSISSGFSVFRVFWIMLIYWGECIRVLLNGDRLQ